MELKDLKAYELLSEQDLKDIKSEGFIMRHKKTGARVVVIKNDDDNKCFCIGFRTPPTNHTGVAHIIEHSVLEGSDAFPVKDPFVELCKSSLNTFLNAMTFPDKTLYPVASCNDLDLHNLIHVYMDAVFRPSIYKNKNIFLQEGWRYEMESPEDDLTINGIVYNEMKGAFSSVDDVIDRTGMRSLYPDTVYGKESGGDPKFIPELTYEDFLDFHRKYYHPSNSYIYLYGNVDAAKELDFIDKEYLSGYDYLKVDSEVDIQKPFEKRKEIVKEFAISDEDEEEGNYHYTLNYSMGDVLDELLPDTIDVLDYALCSVPGAPLKEALINAGIGDDVYSSYESCIRQPYFAIVAKGCKESDREEFLRITEETLKGLVKNGIDKKAIKAGLNYYEFRYREADYGAYPKGLIYGMDAFDSWLYDDGKPFMRVLKDKVYRTLREKAETDYFEQVIDKYLLKNEHSSFVTLKPVKGLTGREDEELREKLAKVKASLSASDIQAIIDENERLKEWQESEDTPEALATIPVLSKEDLEKKAKKLINEVTKAGDYKALIHEIYTNKIAYERFIFNVTGVKDEDLCYVSLFKYVLGLVSTKNYTYGELFNEVHLHTGGMSDTLNIYSPVNSDEIILTFDFKASVLYDNLGKAFELVREVLFESDFTDRKRLQDLINEQYARMSSSILSSGSMFAYIRSLKKTSKASYLNDLTDGIGYFENLEKWYKDFDSYADEIISKLEEIRIKVLRAENFTFDYTGEKDGYDKSVELLHVITERFYKDEVKSEDLCFDLESFNEGLKNSSQVQYVACGGNFLKKGVEFTGVVSVLKVLLSYDYLWAEIRVKGGAYGCSNIINRNGDGCFVSYRDPNLPETVDAFERCADYIENLEIDDETIGKYIIGAIGNLDTPLTPATKGFASLSAYMNGIDDEMIQKERDEVLNADLTAIRKTAKIIRAFMDGHSLCVVGNAGKIDENKEMFDVTRNVITA